jgi:hypothetical protein
VEIDLTKHFPRTVAELARILFTADPRKSWLFNHREATLRAELEAALTATADEQRRAQQAAIKAQQEQWERARAQRAQIHAEEQAAVREHIRQRLPTAAEEDEDEDKGEQPPPPPPRPRPATPAEMSASIEYQSSEGRLWLLHSTRPEVYFKVEPGIQHALQVLKRCGAVEDGTGAYRISRDGWSSASIELGDSWLAIRSVSDTTDLAR